MLKFFLFFTDFFFFLSGFKAEQRQVGSAVPIGPCVSIAHCVPLAHADPAEQSEVLIVAVEARARGKVCGAGNTWH